MKYILIAIFLFAFVSDVMMSQAVFDSGSEYVANEFFHRYVSAVNEKRDVSGDVGYAVVSRSMSLAVNHYYAVQTLNGLNVVGTESSVHVSRSRQSIVKSNMKMVSEFETVPYQDVDEAMIERILDVVANELGLEIHDLETDLTQVNGLNGMWTGQAALKNNGMPVRNLKGDLKEIYFSGSHGEISHAVQVKIGYDAQIKNLYIFIVDTENMKILSTTNLVKQISYLVLPENAADPYGPLSATLRSPVSQVEITVDSVSSVASPAGWVFSNETVGNNVDAFLDLNAPEGLTDGTSDRRVPFSEDGKFLYSADYNSDPSSWEDAAVVQAFYSLNYIHDIMYHFGFNEIAGNYQLDNFGRGGISGDPVLVHVQLYTDTNNAYMTLETDGTSPQIGMFVTSIQVPSDIVSADGVSYKGINSDGYGAETFSLEGPVSILPCGPITDNITGIIMTNISCWSGGYFVSEVELSGGSGVIFCHEGNSRYLDPSVISPSIDLSNISIPVVYIQGEACGEIASKMPINVTMELLESQKRVRDTSLSKDILYHEYGHGISGRLIGGPDAVCVGGTQETGSEGWSDYFALAFLDDGIIERAGIGRWSFGQNIRQDDYFMNNGFNFGEIPIGSGVHDTGFFWANFLWDMHLMMRDKFGYEPLTSIVTNNPFNESKYGELDESSLDVYFYEKFESEPTEWTNTSDTVTSSVSYYWSWFGNGSMYVGGTDFSSNLACSPGTEDTGIGSLYSPVYTYNGDRSVLLYLEHSYSIESQYDGGQVHISVNGGDFVLVTTSVSNGYNDEANSFNPLDGPTFAGDSEIITSVFSLEDYISPGDSYQLGFFFGRDCCCGRSSWTIYNVSVMDGVEPRNHDYSESYGENGVAPGNWISLLLVTEGLKFVDCNPDFIESRDGILAASQSIFSDYPHNVINCIIWKAAAGRGMGFNASSGTSNVGDEIASFDLPPYCTMPLTYPDQYSDLNPFSSSIILRVTENDWLGSEPTTLLIAESPMNGNVSIDGVNVVYTSNTNYCVGDDEFVYTLVDAEGNEMNETVTLSWDPALCALIPSTSTSSSSASSNEEIPPSTTSSTEGTSSSIEETPHTTSSSSEEKTDSNTEESPSSTSSNNSTVSSEESSTRRGEPSSSTSRGGTLTSSSNSETLGEDTSSSTRSNNSTTLGEELSSSSNQEGDNTSAQSSSFIISLSAILITLCILL
eukprot:TRINITY_DN238_c0_g1_i2.p1 TRINITY_DN238_c0_g1~~TRINITY_DN238_c0_g1_i2.p1  ORF type:complete len:1199 (-),score=304.29 TRINITY_DN238_c0_g1_i2:56-3652(-)